MKNNCLTVDMVEEIQLAIEQKVDPEIIRSLIDRLEDATLPGFMEYLCLQKDKHNSKLKLPDKIKNSELVKSFNSRICYNSNHQNHANHPKNNNININTIEFICPNNHDHINSQEWNLFCMRYIRSTENAGFSSKVANDLANSLYEMTENALLHSFTADMIIVGYKCINGISQFCVVDNGIGVLNSLKQDKRFKGLSIHKDAIELALQDGISRCGERKGGFGFRQVFKSLTSQWGMLRFRSGEGCISMNGEHCDYDQGTGSYPPYMSGFQVSITCRKSGDHLQTPII